MDSISFGDALAGKQNAGPKQWLGPDPADGVELMEQVFM